MSLFDVDGLTSLTADLTKAKVRAQLRAPVAVERSAKAVQQDWRQRASGNRHAPLYPNSITYDSGWKAGAYEAEIGPDKDLPQGALGNLLTYGSANNPPTGHDVAVSLAEAPKLERALTDLADL